MKFKASYFNISLPLVTENLRRFWAIPALAFLAYFLSSVFPILMSYNDINKMYDYIDMCLTNYQPVFMIVHLILPIITAVIVFRYLQSSSSVTSMHSMPLTRAQLFNSSLLSGLILTVLPLLANELMLQAIAKPTYDYYMYVEPSKMTTLSDNAINIFTRINVLEWFWQSLLIVLVIYAISVFAGMVTGNTVMHLTLAFGFNCLVPALYLTFITYCSTYLFGFSSIGAHEDIFEALSPFTQVFESDGNFSIPLQIYYIALTLIFLIISSFLYQKRQMEKAGDSITFNFMIPTICYLIAYFGMTLMGYYFEALSNNNGDKQNSDIYFYAGLIAGAIISFIIGRMIVLKTPRIFNKQTLKSFGIFAIIATLYICSITLDLFGFENRVPHIDEVRGVSSTTFDYSNDYSTRRSRYDLFLFKTTINEFIYNNFYYSDPKNIEALIGLHQELIDRQNEIQKFQNSDLKTYRFTLYYDISNPIGLQREYILSYDQMLNNKYLKQVYESLEFKSNFSFNNLNCEKMTNISLQNLFFYDAKTASNLIITDTNKLNSLLNAMEQDFQDRTYEEYISKTHSFCNLSLSYKCLDKNQKLIENTLYTNVLLTDINTIKWLKDNGYFRYLECTADMIDSIVFTERNDDKMGQTESPDEIITELIISDKKQIQKILNTYSSSETNFTKHYEGYVVYKQITGVKREYSKEIYYDFDTAPNFITDYFN